MFWVFEPLSFAASVVTKASYCFHETFLCFTNRVTEAGNKNALVATAFMLGSQHLLLSVFTAAALALPLYLGGFLLPTLFLLFLAGVFIGSLAPDADAEDAAIFHSRVKGLGSAGRLVNGTIGLVLPLFGFVLKWLVYKPLALVFGGNEHRGLMHSLLGLAAATVLIGVYVAVAAFWLKFFDFAGLAVFLLGFAFGFLLHLAEDACTLSGVDFGYPFRSLKFSGNARTGEGWKVDLFVFLFGLLAIGVWYGFYSLSWRLLFKESAVLAAVAAAWLLLFLACRVRRKLR